MKLKYVIITIIFSLLFINNVDASSANISVSTNKNQVIVGETVTVTVNVSSSSNLGSWTFDVVPSSNLTLTNSSFGGLYIRDVVNSSTQKNKSYTFTFKANSSGTATVSIKNSVVYGYDESSMSVTNGSVSMTLKTKAEIEASYSKNNYLSKLEVEGYDISPSFNKDTLEYSLEVENGVESVNIIASKEDYTASLRGTGKFSVSEGANSFKINVTAQNGSVRTYTLNITVKELKPIEVELNSKKYSVIRKEEFMPKANMYYELKTTLIGEEEVPAYISETTKYTLVALKDEEGNIELFKYDNNEYSSYDEINIGNNFFVISKTEEIPLGYNISTIEINDETYTAYISDRHEYPLLYGMNVSNGKTDFYKYDKVDNTIQRFEDVKEEEPIETNEQLYLYIIIGLFSFTVISYIVFIIILCKRRKKTKELLERTLTIIEKSH